MLTAPMALLVFHRGFEFDLQLCRVLMQMQAGGSLVLVARFCSGGLTDAGGC